VKKIPALKGNVEGIKFEAFVFDALPFAKSSIVMEVRREEEFAPVKNKEGVDSPDSAKKLLMDMYARWLEYCKVNVPRNEKGIEGRIEISSLYALDPDELKRKLPLNIRFTKGSSVCL
jgi:UDP-N-acetylglucosamine/UDP-N-acetylgalactosamine diphosphorylase